MAKDLGVLKYDPNTEAFQMRAQWKKVDNCRKQWFESWSWLLDERMQTLREANAIRQEAAEALPHVMGKADTTKSLKPVPITSTGVIGWLAAKFTSAMLGFNGHSLGNRVYGLLGSCGFIHRRSAVKEGSVSLSYTKGWMKDGSPLWARLSAGDIYILDCQTSKAAS